MRRIERRLGFTLMELLVVMAITALLLSVMLRG
jgi:prepilin-type N-terminal cleavage/methylation domain-containing protein